MTSAQVELWWLPSANEGADAASLDLLDDHELARARRFRFERDRLRYIHRHAFLRRVLAGYLDVAPKDVTIRISPLGQPRLDPSSGPWFSLSHTHGLVVLAVARTCRVGVDIERVRRTDDELDVAATMFSERELALVRAAPLSSRPHVFLEVWTRKESLVKATGRGLTLRLDSFSVVKEDGRWLERPSTPPGTMSYTIDSLAAPPGYIGAVAVAAERFEVIDRGSPEVA